MLFYPQIMKKQNEDIWEKIKEHQKNPEFIKVAKEFVRITTGKTTKYNNR